jgi:hypothetical protein
MNYVLYPAKWYVSGVANAGDPLTPITDADLQ